MYRLLRIILFILLQGWALDKLLTRAEAVQLQWNNLTDVNALCNDYTQAGYYIHPSNTSTDWVIFFESGGACYSATTCNRRYLRREVRERFGGGLITDDFDLARAWAEVKDKSKTSVISPLMTSLWTLNNEDVDVDEIEGLDLLSQDNNTNPDFSGYNHVLVPYCSSDLWLGNDTKYINNFTFDPMATDLQFTFRGFVIFRSLFRELFDDPQNVTGNILIAGSSAGGVGVINHIQWVKQFLPNAAIRVFTDSSWFVNFQDNIYQRFTNYVNISEDSRGSNFNITKYVEEQNETTLLSLILHHEPCNSIELGTLCCISAHCLISNPNYYPSEVPILVSFSIYDVYLLAPSVRGIDPVNRQETSFDVHFDNNGEDSEPVGLNLDFLRIIGEYGGVMNNTLGTTLHQADHLSYFVTSCFQHIYLATSSLWDEGGLFGIDPFEVTGEDDLIHLRHTVESGRWTTFKLSQQGITLRDAIGIWWKKVNNGSDPVEFRDSCYTAHCNEYCPEDIDLQLDNSYLWSSSVEILVYCIVGIVTMLCFIMKGIFFAWHWWLLRNQELFLEHSKDTDEGNANFQFPECTEKISIACLNLKYSVPFSNKKYKESKQYDVDPIILPVFHEPDDGDDDNGSNHSDDDVEMISNHNVDNDDDVVLTAYNRIDSKESENSGSGFVHSTSPLLSTEASHYEATPFPDTVGRVFSKMIGHDEYRATKKIVKRINVEKIKTILKGISLYFNPGQLVAIMGPSGSGKTTFLDLLTGRRKYGTIQGEIYVNGIKLDDIRDWYVANSGYVLQLAMPYYEELTVRENLTLAAQMRLSSSFSMSKKFERVEQVMYETGLQGLADTVVGAAVGAGLSGGQKKRLTIAQQLLRLPSVLYLDEPTSGLDSASSYELLTYLNRLADSQRTVIMTIHQPRMEIFHMFSRLIMLCEGQVAYHGVPTKAYEVFTTALKARYLEKGFALPELEDQNPADVIMDMLGNAKMREAILYYYQDSGDPKAVFKAIQASQDLEEDMTDSHAGIFFNAFFRKKGIFQQQGSFIDRIAALEARASLRSSKAQMAYLPVIFFFYGFLLGTVYIQTTSALLIVSGFCVYSVASALFMFPIMHTYYSQALTLYHLEHSDGIGSASDLVIQGFSRFVFLGLIPVTLCAGILYLLVIQVSSYSLAVYLQVLVVNMALNQTWIALLIFVLSGFPTLAFRLSPVISSVAGFTSGFFIPRDSMPPWYRWLFYINPNYYGFSSTSYLLLTNFDSRCDGTELECYITSGEYTLTQFNFEQTNPAENIVVLLAMTGIYLILAVVALWIRHTDFKPVYRRLQSWILRSKGKTSEYDKWSRAQAPHPDFFASHGDRLESYEMSQLNESDEEPSDEVDNIDETCFESPHAVELEMSGHSLDTITSTQSAPSAINIGDDRKPLQPSSLPTVEEISEDPLPPPNELNEAHTSYEQLLSPDSPMQSLNTRTFNRKVTISSSSLPHNGVATKQHSEMKGSSSVNPKPLLHTASSSTLIPNASEGNVRQTAPSNVPTSTKKRREDILTRRRTYQEFSSQSVAQRPTKLPIRRGSRFHSKFLNDNEDHVIWKPEKSPHNVTSTSDPIKKKTSTSTMTPATDYGVGQSKSCPDGDGISPISENSPVTAFSDFRLRQQQLLQRVTIAREVGKNQNNKLYMPEMSEEDKKRTLKLASRYVSYRLSKKPGGMGDVVFQAMADNKPASPADARKQLTVKEKWQKAALLSSGSRHTPDMKRPSMASLRSNRSELQLVKINTLGQQSSKPRHPHACDIKPSYSDQELSKIDKESSPKTKPPLKSRATAMGITTTGLEDVVEIDGEKEVTVGTGNVTNNHSHASPRVKDKPHGHGWSGSIHSYDNPIARFSQLYMSGSSSTMGDGSVSSLQEMDHSNPTIVLSKARSSSTRDLCSAATLEEGLSHVQLRQSRSYGSLLRPVSLEKAVRVPENYQFQQESDTSLQDQPNSMVPTTSGMDSVGSPEVQSNEQPVSPKTESLSPRTEPVSPKTEPESFSPRASSVQLSPAIVSTSSVIAHMIPADDPNDKVAIVLSPSHEQGEDHVTSTSMYAGRQEHHHGEKSPTSSSVFI